MARISETVNEFVADHSLASSRLLFCTQAS